MKKKVQILILMALMLPFALQAQQSLTVYDGDTTNNYVPVYGFYTDAYLRSQIVYPAEELSSMDGATITGMDFYASQGNVSWGDASFEVKLTEIGSTTLTDFDNSSSTTVYTGELSITDNTMTVTFTTPYTYQGGNLLVEFDNLVKGSYASSHWYGETVEGASVSGYSYGTFDEINATSRDFIPKTTFLFEVAMYTISLTSNDAHMGSVSLRAADNSVFLGDLVKSFDCTSDYQYGLFTDGTNIYTTSWTTDIEDGYMFHVYNSNGDFIEAFSIPNLPPLRDITTDGSYFYGGANSSTIYVIDLANRTVVDSIICPGATIRHIAYDPVRNGFWVGSWETLDLYDRNGNKVQEGPSVNSVASSSYYNNGGEHLLLFSQVDSLYDYNITANTISDAPIIDFSEATSAYGKAGGSFVGMYNGQLCWFGSVQDVPNHIGIFPLEGITTLTVAEGTLLIAEATANEGFRFRRWSDEYAHAVRTIRVTDDLSLTAFFSSVGIPGIDVANMNIHAADGRIIVRGADGMTISVYDMMGREVIPATTTHVTPVLPNGVYLVKVGTLPAQKVVVY